MRTASLVASAVVFAVLAACAPAATTIQPSQLIVEAPYQTAFTTVVESISTQPYPSDTSGWVLTDSDQSGGFISAQLSKTTFVWGQGNVTEVQRVSVAINDRGDGTTAVSISRTSGDQAQEIARAIEQDVRAL